MHKLKILVSIVVIIATTMMLGTSLAQEQTLRKTYVEQVPLGPELDVSVAKASDTYSAYPNQELTITIAVTNNEPSQVRVRVVEELAPNMVYTDPISIVEKNFEGLILRYYVWVVDVAPDSVQDITYHVTPTGPGTYCMGPTLVLDQNGFSHRSNSIYIEIICNPNGACDPGENFMNCPEDCTTGLEDGVCDAAEDGINDPDCSYGTDPDYDPDADTDGDGVPDKDDVCPGYPETDSDLDGKPDDCDVCPNDPENDVDNDGVCADVDNCLAVANPNQADCNNNGIGDACDEINPGAIEIPGNAVDENCDGTSRCDSSAQWKNHGQFVSCVAKEAEKLVEQGLITEEEKDAIVSKAAKSDVGKSAKGSKKK